MNKMRYLFKVLKCYGFSKFFFRLKYVFVLKSSSFVRRFSQNPWSSYSLGDLLQDGIDVNLESYKESFVSKKRDKFFFDPSEFSSFASLNKDEIVQQAEGIVSGKIKYFSKLEAQFDNVPDWFKNPFTGQQAESADHWTKISDFSSSQGDIKFIWESSRFAWVYPLVRAYAVTKDAKYAEHFWKWFEDWLEKNQPNTGPNYKCGQECAIRCFAVCFGLFAFMDCPESTPKRVASAVTMLAVHADRISKNIDYARYQNNNHAISEANGLYTIGTLFPEFKDSGKWRSLGKKVLHESALKQISEDGSYVQHSMNYHRLVLDNYLWAIRLAKINGEEFSEEILSRINKAFEFLYQMQDLDSGRVPNYGANDGTLLFPLTNCDYLDYRPVLGAISFLLRGKRLYENGPWDEKLSWFFGSNAVSAEYEPIEQQSVNLSSGGYYTLRSDDSWAMTRCHSFRTRPSHADMLTVDLWYKGINILRDSGSYQYNCEPLWQDYFKSTSAHNTIVVDGLDQMTKGTTFMWFDWTKSKTTIFKSFQNDQVKLFQGEHYGYRRDGTNVIHRRAIMSIKDNWLIVDDVIGSGEHDVELFWHLADCDIGVLGNSVTLKTVQGPVGLSVMSSDEAMKSRYLRGNEKIPAGWDSLYYGHRKPSPVFITSGKAGLPLRAVTLVCTGDVPEQTKLSEDNTVSWLFSESRKECKVLLNPIEQSSSSIFNSYEIASKKVVF